MQKAEHAYAGAEPCRGFYGLDTCYFPHRNKNAFPWQIGKFLLILEWR